MMPQGHDDEEGGGGGGGGGKGGDDGGFAEGVAEGVGGALGDFARTYKETGEADFQGLGQILFIYFFKLFCIRKIELFIHLFFPIAAEDIGEAVAEEAFDAGMDALGDKLAEQVNGFAANRETVQKNCGKTDVCPASRARWARP